MEIEATQHIGETHAAARHDMKHNRVDNVPHEKQCIYFKHKQCQTPDIICHLCYTCPKHYDRSLDMALLKLYDITKEMALGLIKDDRSFKMTGLVFHGDMSGGQSSGGSSGGGTSGGGGASGGGGGGGGGA